MNLYNIQPTRTQKSPYSSTTLHQPQLRKTTMVRQGSAAVPRQGRRGSLGTTSKQDPIMKTQFSRSVKHPTVIRSQAGNTHSRQSAVARTQEPDRDDQLMIRSARIVRTKLFCALKFISIITCCLFTVHRVSTSLLTLMY